ncbi:MAG: bifunctional diaminohydroxyphosphoribosylaminopyrimidine deaminase/5-amino-6-(5-phosphoribosylamino)uracil reductase, partial [Cylindrospermopsis raciborskii]
LGLSSMTESLVLERVNWRTIGCDCLVEGYLPQKTVNPHLKTTSST